jgi:membrane protein implicated in regulation of membrane protease activity
MFGIDSWTGAWITVALVSAIIEVSVPHFGMMFVTVAAIPAACVAFLGYGVSPQLTIFIIVLAASLLLLRPRMMNTLDAPGVPTRTAGLVGREGVVTHDIEATVGAGRVNVGGEDWAARAPAPVAAGTRVRVVRADGIVLEVTPA